MYRINRSIQDVRDQAEMLLSVDLKAIFVHELRYDVGVNHGLAFLVTASGKGGGTLSITDET